MKCYSKVKISDTQVQPRNHKHVFFRMRFKSSVLELTYELSIVIEIKIEEFSGDLLLLTRKLPIKHVSRQCGFKSIWYKGKNYYASVMEYRSHWP